MIITITGDLGSGKSTVAKLLAKELGLKHYSSGDLFRSIAKKKGIDFMQMQKEGEKSSELDKEIDDYVKSLGKEQDDFIIDSRLGWHFIPNSFKVYLTVNAKIGAQRILGHKRDEEKAQSVDNMVTMNKQRRQSEEKRYQQYYGVSLTDMSNYDIVIDTSHISAKEVTKKIFDVAPAKNL